MSMEEKTLVKQEKDIEQLKDIVQSAVNHSSGGHFEYKVVAVKDLMAGEANVDKIEEVLNLYGEMGWRLSQVSVNTLGHSLFANEETNRIGNVQEQTILIFERWCNA